MVLRPILGKPVHDPTSGFVGVNRKALEVFSRSFPLEYPEIEALVVLQRRRFRFEEVPCKMRPRTTGRSSITPAKSLYYIAHVLLGVFVNVLKYDRRLRGGRTKPPVVVGQAVSPVDRPEAGSGRQAKAPVPQGTLPPGAGG
jgi:hypothetical protein